MKKSSCVKKILSISLVSAFLMGIGVAGAAVETTSPTPIVTVTQGTEKETAPSNGSRETYQGVDGGKVGFNDAYSSRYTTPPEANSTIDGVGHKGNAITVFLGVDKASPNFKLKSCSAGLKVSQDGLSAEGTLTESFYSCGIETTAMAKKRTAHKSVEICGVPTENNQQPQDTITVNKVIDRNKSVCYGWQVNVDKAAPKTQESSKALNEAVKNSNDQVTSKDGASASSSTQVSGSTKSEPKTSQSTATTDSKSNTVSTKPNGGNEKDTIKLKEEIEKDNNKTSKYGAPGHPSMKGNDSSSASRTTDASNGSVSSSSPSSSGSSSEEQRSDVSKNSNPSDASSSAVTSSSDKSKSSDSEDLGSDDKLSVVDMGEANGDAIFYKDFGEAPQGSTTEGSGTLFDPDKDSVSLDPLWARDEMVFGQNGYTPYGSSSNDGQGAPRQQPAAEMVDTGVTPMTGLFIIVAAVLLLAGSGAVMMGHRMKKAAQSESK